MQAVSALFFGSAKALLERPDLARLLEALNEPGEETRIVGGAVRDALLGRMVKDIDLATTLLPRAIIAKAAKSSLRAIPTGFDHGTVTVLVGQSSFEITTLREDIATDGRHALVRPTRDFFTDARRRDFTINALSLDTNGDIYDFVGGLSDLAARRVRFIGEPLQRIGEDHLRSLRFFRFTAAYGQGKCDQAGLGAVIQQRRGLASLSRERVCGEILKFLAGPMAPAIAVDMAGAGLWQILLHGIALPARLARLAEIEAAHQLEPDPVLRLASLAVLVREDAARLRLRLHLSNAQTERLEACARLMPRLHLRRLAPQTAELKKMLFLHGRQACQDALLLTHSNSSMPTDSEDWRAAFQFVRDEPLPHMPFSGADLKERGMAEGRSMGETLKALQGLWIRAGFPQNPAVLATLLDDALEGKGRLPEKWR